MLPALLLCLIFPLITAYSSGAPPAPEICSSLRPNHPGDPQTEKFPYRLQLGKRAISPGNTLTFSIRAGANQKFKGFLVQGRRVGGTDEPVGSFVVDEADKTQQAINCGDLDNSAVTHKAGDEKSRVNLKWKAPAKPGVYELITTVVHSGKVYWVGVPSLNITVQ